jgi:hypothetical protein
MDHSEVGLKKPIGAGQKAGQSLAKRGRDGGGESLEIMLIDDPAQPDYNQKPRLER